METLERSPLEELQQASETFPNPYVQKWKEKGGKVIGYYCCYVPEEIFEAAGLLAVRIRATGSRGSPLGDARLSDNNCFFARHTVDQALKGEYDFLDGVVSLNSCNIMHRVHDTWERKIKPRRPTIFTHIIDMPRMPGNRLSLERYWEEVSMLKAALEAHFGNWISEERLSEAILRHNRMRRALRQLYEVRKQREPPVTGAETLSIVLAATSMPKDEFSELLEAFLVETSGRRPYCDCKARLMLSGPCLDNPEYVKIIEDLGGCVVADSLCFGSRYFWDLVDEEGDRFDAIVKRYHERLPSCPRMFDHERRLAFTRKMMKDFDVDGLIISRMMFCLLWGAEAALHFLDSQRGGWPLLLLEREYLLTGVGALTTRVQAFLEAMKGV